AARNKSPYLRETRLKFLHGYLPVVNLRALSILMFEECSHMERSLEQQIRERAYDIWNATGREDGRAAEHWLSAERELLASQAAAAEVEIRRSKKSKGNRLRVTLSR